ncbi:MAG: hypothetical protein AB8G15_06070 [Saprospiraceae bacterium]
MKTLNLCLLSLFAIVHLHAQTEAVSPSFIAGGNLSFSTTKQTTISFLDIRFGQNVINDFKDRTTSFAINPYLGKEMNAHWMLGFNLNYQITRFSGKEAFINTPTIVDIKRQIDLIGGGVFARYTINPQHDFSFFIQPELQYNTFIEKEFQDDVEVEKATTNFFDISTRLGAFYEINRKFRLTLYTGGLFYRNGKTNFEGEQYNFDQFSTNFNFNSWRIGFEFKF